MPDIPVAPADPTEPYDSRPDTWSHIHLVRMLIDNVVGQLEVRASVHDESKLRDPEKSVFDEFTPKLKASTYGSEEYKQFLVDMGPALAHHYAENSHHPEHHDEGIVGMTLLDLIEMLCDWYAAGQRHADGNLKSSLEKNRVRFNIPDDLYRVLLQSAKEMFPEAF